LEAEIAELQQAALTESPSKVHAAHALEERHGHEDACSGQMVARLAFLEASAFDVQAALDRSTQRISELEAQAAADAACKTRLKATIALLEKTIEDSTQSSPTMPLTAKRHFPSATSASGQVHSARQSDTAARHVAPNCASEQFHSGRQSDTVARHVAPTPSSGQVHSGRQSDTVARHVAPCVDIADPPQLASSATLRPAKIVSAIHTPVLTACRVLQEPRWSVTSTAVSTCSVPSATPVTSQPHCWQSFNGPLQSMATRSFAPIRLQERVTLPYSSLESLLLREGSLNQFVGNQVH